MEAKVTVLTPNGRRQNIKVTPNTTLLQILEEACQKHGFDSDEFCLKHHNREVGLTQMFRFSGLPNNCLLEMSQLEKKRVVADVDICVQLEDGSRAQGQFDPSMNLWQVVEQLTAQATAEYESPVAIFMRQEIIGKELLEKTTLKSLGITEGRAMIRFINKKPEELKTQANVYVAPAAKESSPSEEDESAKGKSQNKAGGGGGFAITKDLVKSLKKDSTETPTSTTGQDGDKNIQEREKPKYDWGTGTGHSINDAKTNLEGTPKEQEDLDEEMDVEPEIFYIGERNAIVYSLNNVQKQIEDLPDSFFDLTVHDLKLVLRDLKKISAGSEDEPLMTEKLRQLEESKTMLNKIAQYKNCVIRVQFPDRHVLQGMFKPHEKVSHVVEFVKKFLHDEGADFHLFTIPPKNVLPLDKTLLELDFVPTAVVHFGVEEEIDIISYVKAEFLQKLTTIEGALYAANKLRISNPKSSNEEPSSNNSDTTLIAQHERKSPDASTGAIPKRPRNDDTAQQAM